jgi:hypothetical protein
MQNWVVAETEGLDLGDLRLNKRYRSILEELGDKPAMSIPAACGGWSETDSGSPNQNPVPWILNQDSETFRLSIIS